MGKVRTKKSKTVLKALRILEVLNSTQGGMTNTEIADQLNLNTSTSHRLLDTLKSRGFVNKSGELYYLGYKTFQINGLNQKQERIKELIRPFLMDLEDSLGHTINLGIRRGHKAVPIEIIKGSQDLVVNNNLGKPTPLHASALGKCLLAFSKGEIQEQLISQISLDNYTQNTIEKKSKLIEELEKIIDKGYAIDNEEYREGIICVGVIVNAGNNFPLYVMSVSAPKSKIRKEKLDYLASHLKKTRNRFLDKLSNS